MSVDTDRLRRWRLVLGGEGAEGSGLADAQLSEEDSGVDKALAALYDKPDEDAAAWAAEREPRGVGAARRALAR